MSFIQAFAARADVALPRYVSILNLLSFLLLMLAFFLPLTSSVIVLVISMLVQAAFFRVMHRKKAGLNKLLKRLAFLVISSAAIVITLLQNHKL
jgi:peptidoglycan biosynthesis protein MviN/MurJ (putative lipid II flippase)